MNSAMGNFDNSGKRVDLQAIDVASIDRDLNWCKSKILSLEDEILRIKNSLVFSAVDVKETSNVLDYVSKADWDHFTGLAMVMLANGATLYELQQRLMGLE